MTLSNAEQSIIQSIQLGISDVLSSYSEVVHTNLTDVQPSTPQDFIKEKESRISIHFVRIQYGLEESLSLLDALSNEKIKLKPLQEAIKLKSNLPSMIEKIKSAQRFFSTSALAYAEMPKAIQQAATFSFEAKYSFEMNECTEDSDIRMTAYLQALDEMHQIEMFYSELYDKILSICSDVQRRVTILLEQLNRSKWNPLLASHQQEQMIITVYVLRTAKDIIEELVELVTTVKFETENNINDWKKLLSLY